MSIRNTVKAVTICNNKILLNLCHRDGVGDYYTLPGGGQLQYETMAQALQRECAEETGYLVEPVGFLAMYEEIYSDPHLRQRFPDYAHKCYHLFLCTVRDNAPQQAAEPDLWQTKCVWTELDLLDTLPVYPRTIGKALRRLIAGEGPCFLGTVILESEQPS